MNVPGLSSTTWLAGQVSNFAWIAAESSPPLGERVAQMVVRLGIQPLDVIPGFQAKFLSYGITCACASAPKNKRKNAARKIVLIIAQFPNARQGEPDPHRLVLITVKPDCLSKTGLLIQVTAYPIESV